MDAKEEKRLSAAHAMGSSERRDARRQLSGSVTPCGVAAAAARTWVRVRVRGRVRVRLGVRLALTLPPTLTLTPNAPRAWRAREAWWRTAAAPGWVRARARARGS